MVPDTDQQPALRRGNGFVELSQQPLTNVRTSVSGDSSIMVVIEHPRQARVYQVSNDPVQLTRNISFLVTKASAAAARFASGGVAGN